ncbi:VOC family protein [Thalassotalea mangrovi]|uniref:VOC family protein n=1 Tax=Thalassotalea mangrovi TaxID=2572245 RepID=UPI001FE2B767|nr:VOC family protein [Thalassotalea mangrovi]
MSNTTTKTTGLPGLRGAEHIGFTVPDLEQATHFFVDIIGCEQFYDIGPISDPNGDWMQQQLNVPNSTVIKKLRFFRCKNGSNFEVFEYQADDQNVQVPRNCDVGGHHIAFYVDDFDKALAHLQQHDITILGSPVIRDSGPSAGQTWVYFLSPWGMQFELVSYPDGKGYETTCTDRLWHPRFPEK